MMYKLFSSLEEILNFTSVMVPSFDGKYGIIDANGTWNGEIGRLDQHKIDFSIMDLTVLYDRAQVESVLKLTLDCKL